MKKSIVLWFLYCFGTLLAAVLFVATARAQTVSSYPPLIVHIHDDWSVTFRQPFYSWQPPINSVTIAMTTANSGVYVDVVNLSGTSIINDTLTYHTAACFLPDSVQYAAGVRVYFTDPTIYGTGYPCATSNFWRRSGWTYQGCDPASGVDIPYSGACGPPVLGTTPSSTNGNGNGPHGNSGNKKNR